MTNPFDYLYYKIAKFMLYIGGADEINALPVISILLSVNILTILNFVIGDFLPIIVFSTAIFIYILIMVIYSSNRWHKISERYKNESENHRKWGSAIVILYVILSVLLLIWSFRTILGNVSD